MGKIAAVGCGLIGQSWAVVFARAGYEVAMYDPSTAAAEQALNLVEKKIADLVEFNLLEGAEAVEVLKRVTVASDLENALAGAVYVQESGPERLELKIEITQTLDRLAANDIPIGSSTSGIAASRYCKDIAGRHRCLVVHPINPPHLIPAVEIVPTQWTDQNVIENVDKLMSRCRRETIVLSEEIEGFVVNRLQGALLEEAFKLIGAGIVSAADLDKAVSHGLGLRWSFMGPMRTIHLNAPEGVEQYVDRYGEMYHRFEVGPSDGADWAKVVDEKLKPEMEQAIPLTAISHAQIDRDRKLMALLKHKLETSANS